MTFNHDGMGSNPIERIYIGLSPNGKAQGFDPCIVGSSPTNPVKHIRKCKEHFKLIFNLIIIPRIMYICLMT